MKRSSYVSIFLTDEEYPKLSGFTCITSACDLHEYIQGLFPLNLLAFVKTINYDEHLRN